VNAILKILKFQSIAYFLCEREWEMNAVDRVEGDKRSKREGTRMMTDRNGRTFSTLVFSFMNLPCAIFSRF
jgi:hypothetical protein